MIRLPLFIILTFFTLQVFSTETISNKLSLIPKPNLVTVHSSNKINPKEIQNWFIVAKSFPQTKAQLQDFLNEQSPLASINSESKPPKKSQIIVILKNNQLDNEEYQLKIGQDIVIEASSEQGAFYALQSFKQLYFHDQLFHLEIQDKPLRAWRGNMIDVARHFRSMDYLKRHIQLMAYYKLNKLHLHLSDDQGFRVEIKAFPQLTEISGKTSVYNDPAGFYTQAELKELDAFAKKHHIELIPEIDLPAHTRAITHAYPEFSCDGDDTSKYTGTRVLKTKLCLQKMELIQPFLTKVFHEISQIFSSQYIHIGADEVILTKGFEIEESQNLTKLYQDLINQINAQNKTIIAWEEILSFDLSGNFIAQIWNNKTSVITKAKDSQIPVILSICQHAYFDHGYYLGQEKMTTWCNKNGVTLQDAYSMPEFSNLNVLGIESALWGEFVRNDTRADIRLWPRLLATSESGWSEFSQLNFTDFYERTSQQESFLNEQKVIYFEDY